LFAAELSGLTGVTAGIVGGFGCAGLVEGLVGLLLWGVVEVGEFLSKGLNPKPAALADRVKNNPKMKGTNLISPYIDIICQKKLREAYSALQTA
jgi:hypothetical protein